MLNFGYIVILNSCTFLNCFLVHCWFFSVRLQKFTISYW